MDRYFGQVLKNWAAQQHPPKNLRTRLLLEASMQAYPFDEQANYSIIENSQILNKIYHPRNGATDKNIDLVWTFHLPMPVMRMI